MDKSIKTRQAKKQITLTIAPDILERLDSLAEKTGLSRAAAINLAVYQLLENHSRDGAK